MKPIPKEAHGNHERASMSLDGAEDALGRGNFANAVTESQKCVELSLEGALLAVGAGPGKQHDPSPIILAQLRKFPASFHERAREWADASAELDRLREISVYGDPTAHRTAKELFSDRKEARHSVDSAESVFVGVGELISFLHRTTVQ